MTFNKMSLIAALGASLLATSVSAQPSANFLPHRAVYDLALKEASDRSGIDGLRGRIVYELTGSACEGYAARYRFRTQVRVGGKTLDNDHQSTVFESADGKSFNFVTKYFLNGQLEQDLRGSAERKPTGIAVTLTKPDKRDVDLPNALFMNQHLATIIEAARAGETILTTPVFDGSDEGDDLVDTNAIIGKQREGAQRLDGEPEAESAKFDDKVGWPVSVSYFKSGQLDGGGERLPVYQVSFLLHEDGVSRDLTMRYPDYAMSGVLKNIEYLPVEKCE